MFAAVSLATQFSATGGGRRERGLYEYERRRDPNSDQYNGQGGYNQGGGGIPVHAEAYAVPMDGDHIYNPGGVPVGGSVMVPPPHEMNMIIDHEGNTPLISAAKYGQSQLAFALMDQGADLNIQNNTGDTALMCATIENHAAIALRLIAAGANIHLCSRYGDNCLIVASEHDHNDIAFELLQKGVNVNHQNNFGYTALMYAVKADRINTDLVMTLLNSGANVTLKNRNGKGAIHLTKNHSIKRMLKDRGAREGGCVIC